MTNPDQIATLKTNLAALRAQLTETTDEQRYDQLAAEINQVEKTINLAEARRREEAKAAAEAERQAKIDAHKGRVKQLRKLQGEMREQDQELFAALERFARIFLDAEANAKKAAALADQLQLEAEELDQPPVDKCPVQVAGIPATDAGARKKSLAETILAQYMLSLGQIQDARKNGTPAPDRPGLDWYNKGFGQHWPKEAAKPPMRNADDH